MRCSFLEVKESRKVCSQAYCPALDMLLLPSRLGTCIWKTAHHAPRRISSYLDLSHGRRADRAQLLYLLHARPKALLIKAAAAWYRSIGCGRGRILRGQWVGSGDVLGSWGYRYAVVEGSGVQVWGLA